VIFNNMLENLHFLLQHSRPQDIIDIVLVWLVVYRVLVLIRTTGTLQMLSGLGILAIAYLTSIWFQLYTLSWILDKFFGNLFLIVVVLFQGEIRRALAHIGSNPFLTGSSSIQETHIIEEIAKAAIMLAQKGLGALIVLEKEIDLEYFIETGTVTDAEISCEVLVCIFNPTGPLHDGAVIVRGGRMFMAGCFLPLSKNPVLDKNLGTRHRAALGLTEETDAYVIVVSEETRSVGLVSHGQLKSDLDHAELRRALYSAFQLKFRKEP
jgi:diadenylate cyclase